MTAGDISIPVALRDPAPERLREYLAHALPHLYDTFEILQFLGGNANLTYLIRSGATEFVLKQEPPGEKARSAHDMRREYRMLAAVHPRYPLAPEPVLLCEDTDITGNVFCVMQRLRGDIVRQGGTIPPPGVLAGRLFGLIDAQAQLHAIDAAVPDLAVLGRPGGYRKRQVEGWLWRFDAARTEDMAEADDVIDWIVRETPRTPETAAVIHNDFKLDNLVWAPEADARLAGVLDWEMATIGDPLMDLANTLSFWIEDVDSAELRSLRAMPSAGPGLPTRADALARYADVTGHAIGDFRFYRCFALFRRAVIEQQKFHRFATGQSDDLRYAQLDRAVRILLDACREAIVQRAP